MNRKFYILSLFFLLFCFGDLSDAQSISAECGTAVLVGTLTCGGAVAGSASAGAASAGTGTLVTMAGAFGTCAGSGFQIDSACFDYAVSNALADGVDEAAETTQAGVASAYDSIQEGARIFTEWGNEQGYQLNQTINDLLTDEEAASDQVDAQEQPKEETKGEQPKDGDEDCEEGNDSCNPSTEERADNGMCLPPDLEMSFVVSPAYGMVVASQLESLVTPPASQVSTPQMPLHLNTAVGGFGVTGCGCPQPEACMDVAFNLNSPTTWTVAQPKILHDVFTRSYSTNLYSAILVDGDLLIKTSLDNNLFYCRGVTSSDSTGCARMSLHDNEIVADVFLPLNMAEELLHFSVVGQTVQFE